MELTSSWSTLVTGDSATRSLPSLFVLVPALVPTGPVKGAIALANAMARICPVSLVAIKPGGGAQTEIHPGVRVVAPLSTYGWRSAVHAYRALLAQASVGQGVASISFCLSADVINGLCTDLAMTCASVRGNLPQNYRHDYGWQGLPLAWAHLLYLRRLHVVTAMTASMARQIRRFIGRDPPVVHNFIDEAPVDRWRAKRTIPTGAYRFCYVGSLSSRKKPQVLIEAAAELKRCGERIMLDVIGEGPLRAATEHYAREAGVSDQVSFHGHKADPFELLSQADCMVLPSLSEGVSRAVLEALHLGVPVVCRNTDGSDELMSVGQNGALFQSDAELPSRMLEVARWSRGRADSRYSLLPAEFRQEACAARYLELIRSCMADRQGIGVRAA